MYLKMKRNYLLLIAFFVTTISYCQEFQKPSSGKSLVYFARFNGTGAVINFKYFDGDKYLGKMNGVNYFTYECDPGQHLFWVSAENRDYITGDLKADATYILEVRPTMGVLKASVKLMQISPEDKKGLKWVGKLMAKKEPVILKGQEKDHSFFIENGLDRYEKIKDKVTILNPAWTF